MSAADARREDGCDETPRRPRIVIMAGLARDRTIGRDGGIPWRYPEDMKRFRAATTGTVMVMGRKTMDSIGRALPGRETVVVSRDPDAVRRRYPGVHAAASLPDALDLAASLGRDVITIQGGGEIYRLALPLADEMWLTYVPDLGGGDVFFPAWDPAAWREAERETVERVEVVRYVRVR